MLRDGRSGDDVCVAPQEIRLDAFGEVVTVARAAVEELRATAAARAGVSSQHRDLSLALDRALAGGTAALGRSDLRALLAVVEEHPDSGGHELDELVAAARRRTA